MTSENPILNFNGLRMSASKEIELSLKVMISKEKDKVLFAEADSDFVDVLLSFLTLPLGKILKLLQKHNRYLNTFNQCVPILYDGLSNLSTDHFWSEEGKRMLLNPTSSFEAEYRKLKLSLDDSEPAEYFTSKKKSLKSTQGGGGGGGGDGGVGVFTEKTMSFLISDDLRIVPIVQGSIIQPLSDIGITDIAKAELRTVTLGLNQIMNLLGESLCSDTPLTNVVIGKEHDYGRDLSQRLECLKSDIMHQIKKEPNMNFKKMTVKAILQKSTNSFLFVLAKEDFVDFLFSFLTISLGGAEYLCNSTSAVAIDNLYRSAANLNNGENPKTRETLNRLIKPEIPPKFMFENTVEEDNVKGPAMFMVTNSLTVTPSSLTSSLSVLNKKKIPLSDVKELEVHVGLEEHTEGIPLFVLGFNRGPHRSHLKEVKKLAKSVKGFETDHAI